MRRPYAAIALTTISLLATQLTAERRFIDPKVYRPTEYSQPRTGVGPFTTIVNQGETIESVVWEAYRTVSEPKSSVISTPQSTTQLNIEKGIIPESYTPETEFEKTTPVLVFFDVDTAIRYFDSHPERKPQRAPTLFKIPDHIMARR